LQEAHILGEAATIISMKRMAIDGPHGWFLVVAILWFQVESMMRGIE
jgi:hypothetical protein